MSRVLTRQINVLFIIYLKSLFLCYKINHIQYLSRKAIILLCCVEIFSTKTSSWVVANSTCRQHNYRTVVDCSHWLCNRRWCQRKCLCSHLQRLTSVSISNVTYIYCWLCLVSDMIVQCCSPNEKQLVDKIIDQGPRRAGDLDFKAVHGRLL